MSKEPVWGSTLLQYFAWCGNRSAVALLLQHGSVSFVFVKDFVFGNILSPKVQNNGKSRSITFFANVQNFASLFEDGATFFLNFDSTLVWSEGGHLLISCYRFTLSVSFIWEGCCLYSFKLYSLQCTPIIMDVRLKIRWNAADTFFGTDYVDKPFSLKGQAYCNNSRECKASRTVGLRA